MMMLKLILTAVILMAIVFMALGIKLLFDRKAKIAIGKCCHSDNESSCICEGKTDCRQKQPDAIN
jgi:hypothetical protein